MDRTEELPLPAVCRKLNISWAQAWRLLLRGDLQGRQVRGRWMVSAESVSDLRRRRRDLRRFGEATSW